MDKVLIAGATGYLGAYVLQEFKKQGYWTRALSRRKTNRNYITDYTDDLFIGEITNNNSLAGCCEGIDVVFSSIGITKQKDGVTYWDVDYNGNLNLLNEAKKENVSKFIYVSVFNANQMTNVKAVQAKLKFEKELAESGLDYAIIQPNGFFSDMLEYFKMAQKGNGFVFGSGAHKINPIHGQDLAKLCVAAVKGQDKEIPVGGPDIFTHNQILEMAFTLLNKKSKIHKIPNWINTVTKKLMVTFTPLDVYGPVEFFMTVLSQDMVAPVYGTRRLDQYFIEHLTEKN